MDLNCTEEQKKAFRALEKADRVLWLSRQVLPHTRSKPTIQENKTLGTHEISLVETRRSKARRPLLALPMFIFFPFTLAYFGIAYALKTSAHRKFKEAPPMIATKTKVQRAKVTEEGLLYLARKRNEVENIEGLRIHVFEQEVAQKFISDYEKKPGRFHRCSKLRRKSTSYWESALRSIIKREQPTWTQIEISAIAQELLYGRATNANAPDGSSWKTGEARVHSFELIQKNTNSPIRACPTAVHHYAATGSSTRLKICHSGKTTSSIIKAVTKQCSRIDPLEKELEKHFCLTYQEAKIRQSNSTTRRSSMDRKKVRFLNRLESDLNSLENFPHPCTKSEFASLMLQVALQIQQLHNKHVARNLYRSPLQILHLDIKPANIMFIHQDSAQKVSPRTSINDIRLQLIDFNLALAVPAGRHRMTHDLNGKPIARGTGKYTPPEIGTLQMRRGTPTIALAPTPHASTKSDIYSFGKTMEELSCKLLSHRNSHSINGLLSDMLEKDPLKRPTIHRVCQALKRIAEPPSSREREKTKARAKVGLR